MAGLSPTVDDQLPVMAGGQVDAAPDPRRSPQRYAAWVTARQKAEQPQINDATDKTPSSATAWNLENDPVYQQAMAGGQSVFNTARANALAQMQNQQIGAERQLSKMGKTAAEARRGLAGNFAARGMMGGARGAYYRAQDAMNADDIAAQTSVKDQMSELSRNFLANYGNPNDTQFDWTATGAGQQYRSDAVQQAIASLLARYGTM